MGECEKVGKMRFYPKPAGRPEFPAPILQGKQLAPRHAAIVTVFAARAAAPP
ncbi:DnaA regulatory inactivator Hda, partial [Burkholderia pseudomallei]|nr:DnaA regulatory inactivator Hda [Burkholderia pseudomallei]